ncbi:unnamed protein product, partial [Nesidiocoris tenuis]
MAESEWKLRLLASAHSAADRRVLGVVEIHLSQPKVPFEPLILTKFDNYETVDIRVWERAG